MNKLLTALVLMLAASASHAQSYIGAGVLQMEAGDFRLNSVALTYDYKPTDNFSLQVGLASGGDDTYFHPLARAVEIELDYSLFAKGKLGLMYGKAFFYGAVGYANFNVDVTAPASRIGGFSVSQDGNGSLLGAGVDFAITDIWGVGLEYARGFGDLEDTNLLQGTLQYRF